MCVTTDKLCSFVSSDLVRKNWADTKTRTYQILLLDLFYDSKYKTEKKKPVTKNFENKNLFVYVRKCKN